MNERERDKNEYFSDTEKGKNNNLDSNREKSDYKLPYDMKTFWKTIEEKFFTFKDENFSGEILQKIISFSKYGK
jgi:hypothetical protein